VSERQTDVGIRRLEDSLELILINNKLELVVKIDGDKDGFSERMITNYQW